MYSAPFSCHGHFFILSALGPRTVITMSFSCLCGKTYMWRTSLHRHKQSCPYGFINISSETKVGEKRKSEIESFLGKRTSLKRPVGPFEHLREEKKRIVNKMIYHHRIQAVLLIAAVRTATIVKSEKKFISSRLVRVIAAQEAPKVNTAMTIK